MVSWLIDINCCVSAPDGAYVTSSPWRRTRRLRHCVLWPRIPFIPYPYHLVIPTKDYKLGLEGAQLIPVFIVFLLLADAARLSLVLLGNNSNDWNLFAILRLWSFHSLGCIIAGVQWRLLCVTSHSCLRRDTRATLGTGLYKAPIST